jgi:hypothetical protein
MRLTDLFFLDRRFSSEGRRWGSCGRARGGGGVHGAARAARGGAGRARERVGATLRRASCQLPRLQGHPPRSPATGLQQAPALVLPHCPNGALSCSRARGHALPPPLQPGEPALHTTPGPPALQTGLGTHAVQRHTGRGALGHLGGLLLVLHHQLAAGGLHNPRPVGRGVVAVPPAVGQPLHHLCCCWAARGQWRREAGGGGAVSQRHCCAAGSPLSRASAPPAARRSERLSRAAGLELSPQPPSLQLFRCSSGRRCRPCGRTPAGRAAPAARGQRRALACAGRRRARRWPRSSAVRLTTPCCPAGWRWCATGADRRPTRPRLLPAPGLRPLQRGYTFF